MFSAFLGGCSTPLITIDVKHTSGGSSGSGSGSCHPILLAMGACIPGQGASIPIDGTVKEAIVPGFTVEKTDGSGLMFLPASAFEVDGDTPLVGEAVTVTLSNRKIKKQ